MAALLDDPAGGVDLSSSFRLELSSLQTDGQNSFKNVSEASESEISAGFRHFCS